MNVQSLQFWDTSALIPLVFDEPRTRDSCWIHEQDSHRMAWDWMVVEAHAVLHRRKATPDQFAMLGSLMKEFTFFSLQLDIAVRSAILKLLQAHHLRSADAGHLYFLKQVKKLPGKLEFVCYDQELVRAAKKEGIRVFGEN